MSKPMTELKVQRIILWLMVLMGIACLPLGVVESAFWWATMLGALMTIAGTFGAWRLGREIKATRALEQTVLSEIIFRQEIARTGRLDAAQQAIKRAKPPRWSPFGTKLRA
jgi:hypothetical protein